MSKNPSSTALCCWQNLTKPSAKCKEEKLFGFTKGNSMNLKYVYS